jgi:hypothetical protein
VAGSDFAPLLGLPSGTVCSFASAVSRLTLAGRNIASSGLSRGVRFSKMGALVKRVGCAAQRRCQAFGSLPSAMCCALREAPALGGLAPVRSLLSAISRFLASLPLPDPSDEVSLSLRRPLVRALLTLISQALALVRDVFTVVGSSLSLIRDRFALIRDPVALIRGLLAFSRHPLTRVGHLLAQRRLSLLTTTLTFAAQAVTLALQRGIIGGDLRRPAPDLRADAFDLRPGGFVGRVGRAGA